MPLLNLPNPWLYEVYYGLPNPWLYEVYYGDDVDDFRVGGTDNIGEAYKWISHLVNRRLPLNQPCTDIWLENFSTGQYMNFMCDNEVVPPVERCWEKFDDQDDPDRLGEFTPQGESLLSKLFG